MEFYIDEKQRQRNRRIFKIKFYGGVAVFLLVLGGLFYAVVYSPLFQIKKINSGTFNIPNIEGDNLKISDAQKINEELKYFFANRSAFAKFLGAANILIWDNNVADFLKQRPNIVGLSIKKNYFNRTIIIDFQKRERFGVWCVLTDNQQPTTDNRQLITNNCYWFDRDGFIFERAPKTEGEMIYKVNDLSGEQSKIGERILEKHLMENLLKIFDVLERADLSVRTLQIKDLSLQEAMVEPNNSSIPKIYFSLRFNPEFSLSAFRNLKEIGLEKVDYVDLRVENRAYYKLK